MKPSTLVACSNRLTAKGACFPSPALSRCFGPIVLRKLADAGNQERNFDCLVGSVSVIAAELPERADKLFQLHADAFGTVEQPSQVKAGQGIIAGRRAWFNRSIIT